MKLLKSRWSFLAIALISICLLTGGFWWWNRGDRPSALRNTEGHLALGNPSNAKRDENNYLLVKTQYITSYNNTKHIPNWVSWKLTARDIGTVPRRNDFTQDETLPKGWQRIKSTDYSGSGYDRGHMCPSADRSSNVEDNTATFILTNIIPQARDNNQGPWAKLEDYTRDQVQLGQEAYIVSGGYGQKGVITKGEIAIPAHTWKVIVFVEPGNKGAASVTEKTRIIAVDLPNDEGIKQNKWQQYQTTVRDLEQKTGYDFLSTVSKQLQDKLEIKQ